MFASLTEAVRAAWKNLTAIGDLIATAVQGIIVRAADTHIIRSVFGPVQSLWLKCSLKIERGWQKVLSWFDCDKRSLRVAADKQVAVEAARQLVDVYRGSYTTPIQAEAAVQGYRRIYQQIILPEVRTRLLPPQDLVIIAAGDGWQVMSRVSARAAGALHAQRQAGRHHERQGRKGELLAV